MKKTTISVVRNKMCGLAQQNPEIRLVEAARAGERMAFEDLCRRYLSQIQRAAFRVTRNQEDAEDAVQDALLSALVHIGSFDGRSSFATWLTRIAINCSLMILRKRRSCLETATESMDEAGENGRAHQVADSEPSPEHRCAQKEEMKNLTKAIRKLRPSLREVIHIQQLQERSIQETAKVIGISVCATKSRLFHAKAALRKSPALKMMRRARMGYRVPVLTAA